MIGFCATQPLSPRGERLNVLVEALAPLADVELITETSARSWGDARSPARRLRDRLARAVLLDAHEPESARRLRRWVPAVDAAIVIGFPFSPLSWSARRLAGAGVPYVVDIGDPWALTADKPLMARTALFRARRCEQFIWEHAAGAIVTTNLQAEGLRARFGGLPILVAPNGFISVSEAGSPADQPPRERRELRIVHYGSLYAPRLDVRSLLQAIAARGRWKTVRFTLYGRDWNRSLTDLGPAVAVDLREPRPWREVIGGALEHDLALVVGNHNPAQLPSKAVQYLTLPIPRVALASGHPSDALAAYVSDKPGWLTIRATASLPDEVPRLFAHLDHSWSPTELRPPSTESWSAVSARILAFLSRCTDMGALEEPA